MRLGINTGTLFIAPKVGQQFVAPGVAKPTGLAAVDVAGDIQLTWVDNASAPNNEDNYVVERSADGETWVVIASPIADSTGYLDTTPLVGSNYYRVKAVSAEFGDSNYSDVVFIITGALGIGSAAIGSAFIVA